MSGTTIAVRTVARIARHDRARSRSHA